MRGKSLESMSMDHECLDGVREEEEREGRTSEAVRPPDGRGSSASGVGVDGPRILLRIRRTRGKRGKEMLRIVSTTLVF